MTRGMSARLRPAAAPETVAVAGGAVVAGLAYGTVLGTGSEQTYIWLAAAIGVVLALLTPVGALAALLAATTLIPYATHNRYGVGGGTGEPSMLLVDIVLLVAVARVAVRHVAARAAPRAALVAYALLLLTVLQLLHGISSGWSASDAGTEARRVAMALGAFLVAGPILAEVSRRRWIAPLLLMVGLALGVWGLAQWFLDVPYNGSDAGVREGVGLTSSGRGQLQGGLFAYSIAVTFAFAALVSGHVRAGWPRNLTFVVLATNVGGLLLTYERTFWGAAVLGCCFVLARSEPEARRRALKFVPAGIVALLLLLAAASPGELRTAVERGTSVSQVTSDTSVEWREVESRRVLAPIDAQPLLGSGFGARFTWEPPGSRGAQLDTDFVHNGYLWLAWKGGIPLLLAVVGVLLASIFRRPPRVDDALAGQLAIAAQGSLLGLLLINITFPSFNALGVSAATGLLAALCWMPDRRRAQKSRSPSVVEA
jgi:hypothetical protein